MRAVSESITSAYIQHTQWLNVTISSQHKIIRDMGLARKYQICRLGLKNSQQLFISLCIYACLLTVVLHLYISMRRTSNASDEPKSEVCFRLSIIYTTNMPHVKLNSFHWRSTLFFPRYKKNSRKKVWVLFCMCVSQIGHCGPSRSCHRQKRTLEMCAHGFPSNLSQMEWILHVTGAIETVQLATANTYIT